MSRPCASVPNQNSPPGGFSAFIRLASITGSVWREPRRENADRGRRSRTARRRSTRLAPNFIDAHAVYLMRGSITTQSDVDQMLTTRKNSTITRMQPCTTGMSRSEHAVDQQRAEARPGEQLLDHDRLPHQRAELQADGGQHDARARCARRASVTTRVFAHALGARGADEIGVHDLEHRGTRRARQQRQRRRHRASTAGRIEIAQSAVAVAEARQPAELQREQIHQQQAEPEFRQRQAGDRADHRDRVDEAARPQRRDEAERHADDDREQHGGEDQLQRRPDPLRECIASPARACGTTCRDRRSRACRHSRRSARGPDRRGRTPCSCAPTTCASTTPRPSSPRLDAKLPGMTLNMTKISSTTASRIGIVCSRRRQEDSDHRSTTKARSGSSKPPGVLGGEAKAPRLLCAGERLVDPEQSSGYWCASSVAFGCRPCSQG